MMGGSMMHKTLGTREARAKWPMRAPRFSGSMTTLWS